MTEVNVPLMRKTLEHAEEEVKRFTGNMNFDDLESDVFAREAKAAGDWNQYSWLNVSGTTFEPENIREFPVCRQNYNVCGCSLAFSARRAEKIRGYVVEQTMNCKTTGCFAGHACLLSGDRPFEAVYPECYKGYSLVLDEHDVLHIVASRAQSLLGLPIEHNLFEGDNSIVDLRREAEQLAGVEL